VQKSRPTQLKRQRERAQAERRQEKSQRRQEAKARRDAKPDGPDGEDPDIAGIRLGPQASPYGDLLDDEVAAVDEAVDEK
jgi:hypothetical protein